MGGSCDGKLIMPGLVVDRVDAIRLPVSKSQAEELANWCKQAPFGRGAEAIVDKTVYNTFQLAPEHFKVPNPNWTRELMSFTHNVCAGLGVQSHLTVEAQLYE